MFELLIDATPPTVEYCPGDQFMTSKGGVDLRMTWNEPKFKDNVGIKRIFQNAKSGEMHQPSTLDVSYTAVDFDGNKKDCNFKIHVKSMLKEDIISLLSIRIYKF